MDRCLVCDFPETNDLSAILDRIENTGGGDLIVNLACDFAERAINNHPEPAQAQEWLKAARGRRTDPEATKEAVHDVWIKADGSDGHEASWAVWYAVTSAEWQAEWRAGARAMKAAERAMVATGSPVAEREWQLEHTRKLACTCLVLESGPLGSRSRNSLLAH